jgi:hypothetical protein
MNLIIEVSIEKSVCFGNLEKNVKLEVRQLISHLNHNPCKRLEFT